MTRRPRIRIRGCENANEIPSYSTWEWVGCVVFVEYCIELAGRKVGCLVWSVLPFGVDLDVEYLMLNRCGLMYRSI